MRPSLLALPLLVTWLGCGERARQVERVVEPAPAVSTARAARIVARARPLLSATVEGRNRLSPIAVQLARVSGALRTSGRVDVHLPLLANGALRVSAGRLGVEVRPRALAGSPLEWGDGVAVFADVGDGTHLLRHVDGDGVEDLFLVDRPRDDLAFAFDVKLGEVAGLRLVGGDLELLDAAGVPRLRAPAPIVFDAAGVARRGAIEIEGCAFDASPRGPWGRAPVAPGARSCTIVARVDGRGLAYPVLVDPAWESTASAKYSHAGHHAIALPAGADAGKVLVFGGAGAVPSSTELYDPTSRTWATGAFLPTGTEVPEGSRAVVLADGRVVFAGGFPATGTLYASKRVLVRDPAVGTWSAAADMSVGRAFHAMQVVQRAGKEVVLVAGGLSEQATASWPALPPHASAEVWDPALDAWTSVAALSTPRAKAGSVVADGRVVVVGGETHLPSATMPVELASIEVFDPKLDAWIAGPKLAAPRSGPAVVALDSAKVLVAGGFGGVPYDPIRLDTVELATLGEPTSATLAAKLTSPRRELTATRLADGRVLLAGGDASKSASTRAPTGVVDVFVPATGGAAATVVPSASLLEPRMDHAAVLVPDHGVLVTGGLVGPTSAYTAKSAELFDPVIGAGCATTAECPTGRTCVDGVCCASSACGAGEVCNAPGREGRCTKALGASCGTGAECGSGICVDGVCCDAPCDGTCRTCALPGKVGTCSFAAKGTDPRAECVGGADPTCAHRCDGAGACGTDFAPVGTPCGPSLDPKPPGSPFCSAHVCDWWGACIPGTNRCGLTCVLSSSCDEDTKSCSPTGPILENCLIDGACHWAGEAAAGDPCRVCDPGSSKTTWSAPIGCDAGAPDGGADADAGVPDSTPDSTPDAPPDAPSDAQEDAAVEDTMTEDAATDAIVAGEDPAAELPEAATCSVTAPGGAARRTGATAALVALAVLWLERRRRR